jgi:hypothetical protein
MQPAQRLKESPCRQDWDSLELTMPSDLHALHGRSRRRLSARPCAAQVVNVTPRYARMKAADNREVRRPQCAWPLAAAFATFNERCLPWRGGQKQRQCCRALSRSVMPALPHAYALRAGAPAVCPARRAAQSSRASLASVDTSGRALDTAACTQVIGWGTGASAGRPTEGTERSSVLAGHL